MKLTQRFLAAISALSFFAGPSRAGSGLEQLEALAPGTQIHVQASGARTAAVAGVPSPSYAPGNFAAAAKKAYRGSANYITLYALPSPYAMDWTNLTTLALSFARNQAAVGLTGQTHAIGHVAFEIGCTLADGKRTLVVSGQVAKDKASMNGFLDQARAGAGYSAFFGSVPGRLQTRGQLEAEMDTLSNEKDEVAFLTLKVSRQSCLEAQRYIKAYEAEKVSTRYGLGVRPLYKEGGGCANVGVSVVEVAGPSDFSALASPWSRTFYVPNELLGGSQNQVGLGDVVPYWNYDWSKKPAGKYKELFFYDPDLLYRWIRAPKPGQPAWSNQPDKYVRYGLNNSIGLMLDYTSSSSPSDWWRTDK